MKRTPWNPFDESLADFPFMPRRFGGDLSIDLYEEDSKLTAKMTLPGVAPKDLDITIDDDFLTVSGTREDEKETEERDYYSKEIRRGSFSRTVHLPKGINADAATAEYEDGVLVITVPTIESEARSGIKVPITAPKL